MNLFGELLGCAFTPARVGIHAGNDGAWGWMSPSEHWQGRETVKKLLGNPSKQFMGDGKVCPKFLGQCSHSPAFIFALFVCGRLNVLGFIPERSRYWWEMAEKEKGGAHPPVFLQNICLWDKRQAFWGCFPGIPVPATFQDQKWETEAQRE